MAISHINPALVGNSPLATKPTSGVSPHRNEHVPEAKGALEHDKQRPQDATAPPSLEEVERATKKIQEFVQPVSNDIQFSVDKDTDITVVKIIDRATKEVIRQIPSEEIIDIARSLDRLQGLLIKHKA